MSRVVFPSAAAVSLFRSDAQIVQSNLDEEIRELQQALLDEERMDEPRLSPPVPTPRSAAAKSFVNSSTQYDSLGSSSHSLPSASATLDSIHAIQRARLERREKALQEEYVRIEREERGIEVAAQLRKQIEKEREDILARMPQTSSQYQRPRSREAHPASVTRAVEAVIAGGRSSSPGRRRRSASQERAQRHSASHGVYEPVVVSPRPAPYFRSPPPPPAAARVEFSPPRASTFSATSPSPQTSPLRSTGKPRDLTTNILAASPRRTPLKDSAVHRWQRLYTSAEEHGWSIRPGEAQQGTWEPTEGKDEHGQGRGMFWPLMTPPPARVSYDVVANRHAAALSASQRSRASPPPEPSSFSSRPSLPFSFSSSTPLPKRTPDPSKASSADRVRARAMFEREEELKLRRYDPSPLRTGINLLSLGRSAQVAPLLPESTSRDASPPRSASKSASRRASVTELSPLRAERDALLRQLEVERRSWQEEKRMIWRHYETDIAALMTKQALDEVARSPPKLRSPQGVEDEELSIEVLRPSDLQVHFRPQPQFTDESFTENNSSRNGDSPAHSTNRRRDNGVRHHTTSLELNGSNDTRRDLHIHAAPGAKVSIEWLEDAPPADWIDSAPTAAAPEQHAPAAPAKNILSPLQQRLKEHHLLLSPQNEGAERT